MKKHRIPYPVLYDARGSNAGALGLKGYPAAFVLDPSGKVVWEGVFCKPNHARIETAIQAELKKARHVREPERTRRRAKM